MATTKDYRDFILEQLNLLDVTFDEVKNIYNKCGMEFYDLVPTIQENEKIKNQFYEEIIQEIFRNLLIKNNVADDYTLVFEDCFELINDEYKGVSGIVSVFKDQNNMWNVWETDEDGENYKISHFDNQIEAYIDAAKRRGLNLNTQDFIHNENDVLDIIQSAKNYLKFAIDFYESNNVNKLIQRCILLETFEKEFIEKQDIINEKELTKKRRK